MHDHGPSNEGFNKNARELEKEVSKRQGLEEILKQTEAVYAYLVENAHDIIYKIDLRGRFTFFNPAAVRTTGFSEAELTDNGYLNLIHPDYRKKAEALYFSQYKNNIESTYFEFLMIRKDGGKIWIGQNVQIIRKGKRIVGFHAVARDITRQKQSEKGLKKAQAALKDNIRERTTELENANRELKKEIRQRRESEDKLRRVLGDLEFLSVTAMEFFSLSPDTDIYQLIGNRLWEIAAQSIVIVNDYDPDTNLVCTKSVMGLGKSAERILGLLGKDPVGMITEMNDEGARKVLESGSLALGPKGIYELCFGTVPKSICYAIEKLLSLDQILVIGFSKKGDLFGNAIILTRQSKARETLWERRELIETFINQAAVALQRKRFESALKESESRYRLLAENVMDIIWNLDLETLRFTYISPSIFPMRGFTPQEAMDLPLDKHLAPESFENLRRLLSEELAKDGLEGIDPNRSKTSELEQLLKDGSHAWAEATMRFIRDDTGRPVSVLGVTRDISERKRVEAEKKAMAARLQQARKMEAIATLAGGIAHQFNNALTVIMGRLEILELEPGRENKKAIVPIKKTAARMAELTNQLLAYASGGKYQSRTVSMLDFVKQTLSLIGHLIKPYIQVEMDLDPATSGVKMDSTQMQMVMSAVIFNASEAMDGAGHIHISCGNKTLGKEMAVRFPGLRTGRYVRLSVKDDGRGMDPKTKDHIFEPFFTTKFQGRGLGMAAAYGIVKNHEGWIAVDSEPGKGTTVRIYLPVAEQKVDISRQTASTFNKGSGTILLIEDNKVLMEVGREGIIMMGYEVLMASTGKEAVALVGNSKQEIDLALLDFKLPDMEAKHVFLGLKAHRPNIKVIVCSGYAIDGPVREVMEAGADGFLQKPFKLATLSQKISELLHRP
ncbi:MAG: PAS domain S-box protein [Deltaproteobacteria bacterium]|nr:PAS domain S-box protein [Deltaproteobacteria bacterium]